VPLDSTQAQALMDANMAMIEGGGFTASEVSFRLACMKVLGSLPDRFNVKSWRVIDESDESRNRYVQASMLLTIGNSAVTTTRAEGAVRGCTDKAMRQELRMVPGRGEDAPGRFSVTAIDVSSHDTRPMCASRSASSEGHEPGPPRA